MKLSQWKALQPKATFETWLADVNRELYLICGLGHEDLLDFDTRKAFDAGVKPCACAKKIIRAAKTF